MARVSLHNLIADFEKEVIEEQLLWTKGNVAHASFILMVPRQTLYRKIEKYDISLSTYRIETHRPAKTNYPQVKEYKKYDDSNEIVYIKTDSFELKDI